MKRILISLVTVGAVGLAAFGASQAFFSDTKTSTGNILAAGALDLQIDNTSYYNGEFQEDTSWVLGDPMGLFFNFRDLKPGDEGEDTISLHVFNNDAWACANIQITENDDESCTEPELADDPSCDDPDGDPFDGDLADELNFAFWGDDGDNVLEEDELPVLTQGPASNVLNGVTWTLADSNGNNLGIGQSGPLIGSNTYFIGKAWCYGDLTVSPVAPGQGVDPTVDPGVDCDGSLVNNASQTDLLMGDISFYAEQWRNNEEFECSSDLFPTPTPLP